MRLLASLSALMLLAPAGCATALDTTRNGEPVIETTFSAIWDDPGAWEGKWIRLSGWIDEGQILVVSEKGNEGDWWTMYLDPAQKVAGRDSEGGVPNTAAVVSGRVDLTCARFWANGYRALAAQGIVGSFGAEEPGPLAHCNRARGPNLVNVLVSTPSERAP